MTNLAPSQAYTSPLQESEAATPYFKPDSQTSVLSLPKKKANKKSRVLTREDQQIIIAINRVKGDIECLHNRYDQTTDPLLLDSITYELKAANIKYVYFLNLCKEKGIVGGM